MAFNLVPIAHIAAGVFAIIELGLTAYLVSLYDDEYNGYRYRWVPSILSFLVFASAWSLLVLLYVGLSPLYLASIFRKLASLVLNVITACFWFGGSVALAVQFGGPPGDCGANTWCGVIRAAITFGFLLWALFAFITFIDAIESMRSRGSHSGRFQVHAKGHGEHAPAPAVAQTSTV